MTGGSSYVRHDVSVGVPCDRVNSILNVCCIAICVFSLDCHVASFMANLLAKETTYPDYFPLEPQIFAVVECRSHLKQLLTLAVSGGTASSSCASTLSKRVAS